MKGSKYLSDIIDISTLRKDALNIIKAPTGCGKTYFALNTIPNLCHNTEHEAVYLIDTINGKEQILRNYNAHPATKKWIREVEEDGIWFDKTDTVVVMTYAMFGILSMEDSSFYNRFHYIICDEMHNLIKFQYFDRNAVNAHKMAKHSLKNAICNSEVVVIALTATPNRIIKEFLTLDIPYVELPIDQEELMHYDTKRVVRFTDMYSVMASIDSQKIGILYSGRINSMLEFERFAIKLGFHPICIWSVNNTDHYMNEKQLTVRERILEDFIIPSEYNLLIINSSSETSIKIKSHVDFMIVNSEEIDTQIQVRGRVNSDLDVIYLPMTESTIVVPKEYLNTPLYKEEKTKLCNYLNLRDKSNGRQYGWNKIHEVLPKNGYQLTDGRYQNKRYTIISERQPIE